EKLFTRVFLLDEAEILLPGLAPDGHAASLKAVEDLGQFFLIERLNLFERGAIVGDALAQRSGGRAGGQRLSQVLEQLAEYKLVGIVILRVALQAIEKLRLPCPIGGQLGAQRSQPVLVLLEEDAPQNGGALALRVVERGVVGCQN